MKAGMIFSINLVTSMKAGMTFSVNLENNRAMFTWRNVTRISTRSMPPGTRAIVHCYADFFTRRKNLYTASQYDNGDTKVCFILVLKNKT